MKKIAINIIVCFLLIIPFDFCLEFIDWFRNEILNISIEELKEYNKHGINLVSPFHYTLKHISFEEYYKNESKNYSDDRRITRSSNHNKGAIIIFGDSFAYGAWLDDNETLNYQLSKLTGRTVYNRGFSGTGLNDLLFLTRYNDFYNDIDNNNVSLAVYTFIPEHVFRMYWSKYGILGHIHFTHVGYTVKNGMLVEDNNIFTYLSALKIVRKIIKSYYDNKITEKYSQNISDAIFLYFMSARNELQKRYPNIKFVILKHPHFIGDSWLYDKIYNSKLWKKLEDEGFYIYDMNTCIDSDIFNVEEGYILIDNHPGPKLWQDMSLKLKEDLDL